jgi:hypothetical protein
MNVGLLYLDYRPSGKGYVCQVGRTIDGKFQAFAAHRVNFRLGDYLRVQEVKKILKANPDRTFGLAGQTTGTEGYNDRALPVIETLVVEHNERKLIKSFARALRLQPA